MCTEERLLWSERRLRWSQWRTNRVQLFVIPAAHSAREGVRRKVELFRQIRRTSGLRMWWKSLPVQKVSRWQNLLTLEINTRSKQADLIKVKHQKDTKNIFKNKFLWYQIMRFLYFLMYQNVNRELFFSGTILKQKKVQTFEKAENIND